MSYINLEHGRSNSTNGRTKSTISCWVKRSGLGSMQYIWGWGENNSSDAYCRFDAADNLEMHCDGAGGTYNTTTLYRDVNAWMHIVFSLDGSNATANLRRRLWINGVQIDEGFGSTSTFSAAVQGDVATQDLWIGANPRSQQSSSIAHFDGYISHFHYCDGYSYTASDFGETDATTGEWKIKTSPNVQYGDNGIFCKMEDSSNIDLDSGSNNITLSTSGNVIPAQDNPSNVFCTLNPLSTTLGWTMSNGNNTFNGENIQDWKGGVGGTLGASSGKYYWEVKWVNGDAYSILGVIPIDQYWRMAKGDTATDVYTKSNGLQMSTSGTGTRYMYVSSNAAGVQRTLNDIIMFAIDFDNKKMWTGANGTWDNSGNPATGANASWTSTEFNSDWDSGFIPYCQSYKIGLTTEFKFNFGNGYFGTTAISSEGTNASGIGKFEYDVPTGFTALSTKGLNE